jgi:hypothetical protein
MSKDRSIRLPEPEFLPKRTPALRSETRYVASTHDRQVYFLALLGLTEIQMAQVFDVDHETIRKWRNKYPLFEEALRKGKMQADGEVAHALYQAAVGYKHRKTVVLTNRVQEFDGDGKVIKAWLEPLLVDVEERFPPNVTACVTWLKSRQPGVWRERINIAGRFNVTHQIDLTDFTTEELTVLNRLGVNGSGNGQHVIEDVAYEDN